MKKNFIAAVLTCILATSFFYGIKILQNRNVKENLTVGFISMGDESVPFSENFLEVENVINEKYGDKVKVIKEYNVSQKSVAKAIEEEIEQNVDIIIFDSYIFVEVSKEYAQKYPDIQFCQATGDNANVDPVLSNYHNFMGRISEGRYISGIVAGMKMKELIDNNKIAASDAKVGYVAAFPNAEVISGYTAFILGVRSIVPEATMEVEYINTWNNYYVEEKTAAKMIEDGCVIISQHSDTNGPAIACEKAINTHTVFHVGYNYSMIDVAPTTSLISTKINWSEYIISAIDSVMKGKSIEGNINAKTYKKDSWAGFDENWIQMIDLNKAAVADGTEEAVQKAIDDFKKDKISIYKGNYTATNPENPNDKINLSLGYTENKDSSSPKFHYVLDDVIKIIN